MKMKMEMNGLNHHNNTWQTISPENLIKILHNQPTNEIYISCTVKDFKKIMDKV